MRVALLLLLAAVTVTCYAAEETCYEYQPSYPDAGWYPSISAAGAAHAGYCGSSLANFRSAFCRNISCCSITGFSASFGSVLRDYDASLPEYSLSFTLTLSGGEPETNSGNFHVSRRTAECPDDPCVDAMNLASPGLGVGANVEASGRLCSADDGEGGSYSGGLYGKGCEVIKDGAGIASSDGGHWFGQIKYTGQSCPDSDTPDPLQSDLNCLTMGGVKQCLSKTQKSCGTVAGQRVCLADVPEGSCMLLSTGGAICDAEAVDLPKDEMGDPLEPTSTVTSTSGGTSTSTPGTTKTYNYYSSSVIEESYTPVPGTDGDSDDDGDGGGDDPGECTEEDCTGELPDDLEALDSFQEITQGFMDRVEASDLVASVASLGTSVPTGSCPDWDIEVFGQEISLSAPMCTIWSSISGLLSAVMLIAWGLLAARIVLSA